MAKTLADYDGIIFTSNEGHDFIIVKYLGNKDIQVEFIETGFKKWTRISDINQGKVRDMIAYNDTRELKQECKDIAKQQCISTRQQLLKEKQLKEPPKEWLVAKQKCKSRNTKVVYDVGYYGNVDKSLPYYVKARELWSGILRRCYSGDGKDNSYFLYASVCKRWHCLELFLDDLPNIIGFDAWISGIQMQLDKDLLSDQKMYAPETCLFLKPTINSNLNSSEKLKVARERISQGLINYIPSDALNVKCWNCDWIGFLDNE